MCHRRLLSPPPDSCRHPRSCPHPPETRGEEPRNQRTSGSLSPHQSKLKSGKGPGRSAGDLRPVAGAPPPPPAQAMREGSPNLGKCYTAITGKPNNSVRCTTCHSTAIQIV
ncbi:hypothetical protein SKAU_G00166360 [Synaphobranchus kaupii]|uniref:Uncharacterized protein n=1 Tax=Synaphobranchus kaupii TaxID=118154 RepID=A0A9Q1FJP9_SYNKA|nr:hypothetical protein SKAU_G00166360 [Synaphobranchus kaupii]